MSSVKIQPSLDQVQQEICSGAGNCIPVYTSLPADILTPIAAYLRLTNGCSEGKGSFLLESVEGGSHVGRYSFVGSSPSEFLKTGPNQEHKGDPLVPLESLLSQYSYITVPGIPTFTGGAVGYVSYDCIHYFEPKTARPLESPIDIPESYFMITDTILIFDHLFQTLKVATHIHLKPEVSSSLNEQEKKDKLSALYNDALERISQVVKKLTSTNEPVPEPTQGPVKTGREGVSNVGKPGYESFVTELKKHIVKGDIIQAVPSQRIRRETDLHPFNVYRHLRRVNPSPYMFFIDFGQGDNLQLVGASPECLIKVEEDVVTNHAIAGTIRRGQTPKEDELLGEQLRNSIKDQAEHIMLVDLARNDVNRVCQPETVKVDSLMMVEKFSHVMHLTSQVSGKLRSGKTRFDAFRSIFPAGTVSGAPKIRAMELIGELEKERRGVYAGAVGRFNFNQDAMDTCIAIRTMTFKDGVAYLQAGGGIVFDSDEEEEYVETINKLKANVNCIAQAEEYYASQQ